jgi:hypothetical protein
MSQRKVYEWMEIFKRGGRNVVDDTFGRPSAAVCVEVSGQIDQCITKKLKIINEKGS